MVNHQPAVKCPKWAFSACFSFRFERKCIGSRSDDPEDNKKDPSAFGLGETPRLGKGGPCTSQPLALAPYSLASFGRCPSGTVSGVTVDFLSQGSMHVLLKPRASLDAALWR